MTISFYSAGMYTEGICIMCCRPLRVEGAYMLLTTSVDARRPTRMHIRMMPRDDEDASLRLASDNRLLATADVPAPKVACIQITSLNHTPANQMKSQRW